VDALALIASWHLRTHKMISITATGKQARKSWAASAAQCTDHMATLKELVLKLTIVAVHLDIELLSRHSE
jgi:hypothetical protein